MHIYPYINNVSTSSFSREKMKIEIQNEKYMRPSKQKAINTKDVGDLIINYHQDNGFILPNSFFRTPEKNIIYFFSFLREANQLGDERQGCGTIGYMKLPYPLAYQFLSDSFKQELPYESFLKLFKNFLHINLVKLVPIPMKNNSTHHIFEIETIEGSSFNYYYGYIETTKKNHVYKINKISFQKEDFLCAPYHFWQHNAEMYVEFVYGNWCKLLKKQYPTQQDGYIKRIIFDGTDGNQYMLEFIELTNGTDVQIAQYKKIKSHWESTTIPC